jgi:phospholipid/cholesterol/gamma-HCH transport system ATP-binding protein
VLQFCGVHKSFAGEAVLRGVDLHIAQGGVRCIIGQSGAGKSVLIRMVVGLLHPDRGEVMLEGKDVRLWDPLALRRTCQLVFQSAGLIDSWSVLENVARPLQVRAGLSLSEARRQAHAWLAELGLEGWANASAAGLGLGLQKRVAVVRALALSPEVVLLDEPTTGLDPSAARRMDALIRDLADRRGVTAVVVSHDPESIGAIADEVALLRAGRVAFLGSVAELAASEAPEAQFFAGISLSSRTSAW